MGDHIRKLLTTAPFLPFNVVTSGGNRYPVLSPEHAMVNPRGSRVIIWFDDDSSVTIATLNIASVEEGLTVKS